MKTFITIENVCVGEIVKTSGDVAPSENWIEVPQNFIGRRGDKFPEWFDENKQRINNDILVEQGKRVDKRGVWYDKTTREKKDIGDYDITVDENEYTKDAPIENEQYQKFDRQKNKWVIDTEKKELRPQITALENELKSA